MDASPPGQGTRFIQVLENILISGDIWLIGPLVCCFFWHVGCACDSFASDSGEKCDTIRGGERLMSIWVLWADYVFTDGLSWRNYLCRFPFRNILLRCVGNTARVQVKWNNVIGWDSKQVCFLVGERQLVPRSREYPVSRCRPSLEFNTRMHSWTPIAVFHQACRGYGWVKCVAQEHLRGVAIQRKHKICVVLGLANNDNNIAFLVYNEAQTLFNNGILTDHLIM